MKAIMVMYDSLRRDLMSVNGGPVPTPNFERLAAHSVQFDKCYVGSLPCMPARRELHTGRLNFLHRSWGPVEPFDDSMPEILKKNGIHSHLATDHYHYIQDGGATYHGRYSTWECFRGQESDAWIGDLTPHGDELAPNQYSPDSAQGFMRGNRMRGGWQNMNNRQRIHGEEDFPMHKTFDDGLEFIEKNSGYDNWFLQLETFDPHEPFTSPESFMAGFLSPDDYDSPDWPQYAPVNESQKEIDTLRNKYYALMSYCDYQLGRVLDKMDELDLWKDTMLVVNTDHGFFLGEHDWWGKGSMPDYEELVHTPLFIWDPRSGVKDERRNALVQSIDLAPTILEFFGLERPGDMLGKPLADVIKEDAPVRSHLIFGYHAGPVGITDGSHVLLRAAADLNVKSYEYTLMPTHMNSMFTAEELKNTSLCSGFSFTKGVPVLRIESSAGGRFAKKQSENADLMFDLISDPMEKTPIEAAEKKAELLKAMKELFDENDAPAEIYERYGVNA